MASWRTAHQARKAEKRHNCKTGGKTTSVLGSHTTDITSFCEYLDLDYVFYCVANVSFAIPESTDEWGRSLVFLDQKNKLGFTGAETDDEQWFTIFELFLLGTLHAKLEIKIHSAYVWMEENTIKAINIALLYDEYQDLRKEYKATVESGEAM